MKIVLDAFGGDYAPDCMIEGAIRALKVYNDIEIVLCGKQDILESKLKNYKYDKTRLIIVNAESVITNEDIPTEVIKNKKDSSLVCGFEYLKENEDAVALISTGSTGAILTGTLLKIGRIKGVQRPALAPLLPTKTGGNVLLLDCGANVDCKPEYLCQFAVMGSIYYTALLGIENPRVALLNIGTENTKGNTFYKQVHEMLKNMPINFVGNMEARDITSGNYDIIVADGFDGNIALKASEGAAKLVLGELKSAIKSSFLAKIGALIMKKSLNKLAKKLDYNKYGGSIFLGAKKIVIKSHGSSKPETIFAAIKQGIDIAKADINNRIIEKLNENRVEE